MNKPLLVVVTGSPASGKTTLANNLAGKINYPLLSRDKLKEDLLNTLDIAHHQLDKPVDVHVNNAFFEAIDLLLSKGVSVIAEAAFQDKLWRPRLLSLMDKAEIRIIICKTNVNLIKERFASRLANNPDREKFHGDRTLSQSEERFAALTDNYVPVSIDVPTLDVDTTENYRPDMEGIVRFIRQKIY